MVVPYHVAVASESILRTESTLPPWGFIAMAAGVVLGGLAVLIPMKVGIKTLKEIEF